MGSIISSAAGAVAFLLQNIVNNEKGEAVKPHIFLIGIQMSSLGGNTNDRADSSSNARRLGTPSSGMAGAAAFLIKPVSLKTLNQTLDPYR
jgi:hypothetical protein